MFVRHFIRKTKTMKLSTDAEEERLIFSNMQDKPY